MPSGGGIGGSMARTKTRFFGRRGSGPSRRRKPRNQPQNTEQRKIKRRRSRHKNQETDNKKNIKNKQEQARTRSHKPKYRRHNGTTPPNLKPDTSKKSDARLAPYPVENAVNGGFPTKLGSVWEFFGLLSEVKRHGDKVVAWIKRRFAGSCRPVWARCRDCLLYTSPSPRD